MWLKSLLQWSFWWEWINWSEIVLARSCVLIFGSSNRADLRQKQKKVSMREEVKCTGKEDRQPACYHDLSPFMCVCGAEMSGLGRWQQKRVLGSAMGLVLGEPSLPEHTHTCVHMHTQTSPCSAVLVKGVCHLPLSHPRIVILLLKVCTWGQMGMCCWWGADQCHPLSCSRLLAPPAHVQPREPHVCRWPREKCNYHGTVLSMAGKRVSSTCNFICFVLSRPVLGNTSALKQQTVCPVIT